LLASFSSFLLIDKTPVVSSGGFVFAHNFFEAFFQKHFFETFFRKTLFIATRKKPFLEKLFFGETFF